MQYQKRGGRPPPGPLRGPPWLPGPTASLNPEGRLPFPNVLKRYENDNMK